MIGGGQTICSSYHGTRLFSWTCGLFSVDGWTISQLIMATACSLSDSTLERHQIFRAPSCVVYRTPRQVYKTSQSNNSSHSYSVCLKISHNRVNNWMTIHNTKYNIIDHTRKWNCDAAIHSSSLSGAHSNEEQLRFPSNPNFPSDLFGFVCVRLMTATRAWSTGLDMVDIRSCRLSRKLGFSHSPCC